MLDQQRPLVDLTPAPAPRSLETWRCESCGRIVAKLHLTQGTVQVKCRCNAVNTLTVR
jgi:LSD1 subclass zinc finger protein